MDIDEIIHQPVRTKIMAYLINNGMTDYTTLKKDLSLTDGHMSTHMKKLLGTKYVSFSKSFEDNRPKTKYRVTSLGKKKFLNYLDTIKKIIS